MPIVTDRESVLSVYREAGKNRWVLPCFCTENLTTTEAVLEAARTHGESIGKPDLPIIIAITNQYAHRSQSAHYTHTRRWDIGLRLFLSDLRELTRKGTPYERLRVMIHLDHTQFDTDRELLSWDLSEFSSIMYDASAVPYAENIRLTAQFVKERGHELVIEGACDEIVDAEGCERSELTTAEKAEAYYTRTGVDLIVANLGTEHRASAGDLRYYGDYARKIRDRIGTRIVLHGASSVPGDQMAGLIDDGVCKVNLWTALERDASPALLQSMVENAVKVAGPAKARALQEAGWLGERCSVQGRPSMAFFTTEYRQNIIFEEMKRIAGGYIKLWYRV